MIPPDTSIGKVRLRVADLDGLTTFYERVVGLDAVERGRWPRAPRPRGRRARDRARERTRRAPGAELQHGPLPPRDPGARSRRAGALAPAAGRRRLAPHRRLGPPRERGALPPGPRGQRDRDLPRPAARGVAPRRRRAGDGHAAARPRERARRARERRRAGRRNAGRNHHGPRSPSGGGHPAGRGLLQRRARPRRDGALVSRARSSWPPAATTITSGSTPGRARARPPPPEGALGLDHFELVLPSAAERDSAADRLAQAGADPQRTDEGVLATDPSGNRVLLTARDS